MNVHQVNERELYQNVMQAQLVRKNGV